MMFDKERFQNTLALSLGYERIVNDKRITIDVDDSDDPCVTLKFQGCSEVVRVKASDEVNEIELKDNVTHDEIRLIVDAVHQAYNKATSTPF